MKFLDDPCIYLSEESYKECERIILGDFLFYIVKTKQYQSKLKTLFQ